jgi:two-component system CheB/CheR fusion protein
MATNAVKYGSLSVPNGKIDISWQMENTGETTPERLRMSWVERGGPPVMPPAHKGFGHTVFERIMAKSLNGDLALDFAPEGLDWRLSIPANLNDSRAVFRDRFDMESNR